MMQRFGMAVGAGFAAALLFAAMAKDTVFGMGLVYLAPLPILIVALGWGLDMGALAGAVACAVILALFDFSPGEWFPQWSLTFALAVALPAWLLAFFSLLPRERLFRRAPPGEKQWFPVGGVVSVAALIGALSGASMLAALVFAPGGYRKGVDAFAAQLSPALTEALDGVVVLPTGLSVDDFAAMIVRLAPMVWAAMSSALLCANLYAGARAVHLSQRLQRPWPNVPESLTLPPALGVGLVLCIGFALGLHGLAGQVAWIGVGALGCVYVMQGLAVIHSLSRGLPLRIPILVALYPGCLVVAHWSAPALAAIGLVESALSLRARRTAAANAKS